MLNINYGHNKELMLKCKKLEEYSEFVALVRKFREDKEYERARADKAEARIAEAEAKTAEAEAKTAEAEAKTAEAEAVTKATLVENEHLKKILREHNIDI